MPETINLLSITHLLKYKYCISSRRNDFHLYANIEIAEIRES